MPDRAYSLIARKLAGMPVDLAEIDALPAPIRDIAGRVASANGGGPMAAFEAALADLLSNDIERAQFRKDVFAVDPRADSQEADKEPRFRLYTAADALGPQSLISWLVQFVIMAGGVVAVVGEPGCKKTWCMLALAVCLALGIDWAGQKTSQARVLIVDEESGQRRLAKRLADVLRGYGGDENTPVFYTSLAQLDLRNSDDLAALRQLIVDTGAGLVIIDALADVMPGADENAVKDVQSIFRNLRRLAEETGCTILLVHHVGKNGLYRGSSAISGAVDLLLRVESRADSKIVTFKFDKARDAEPFTFAAEAFFGADEFRLMPATTATQAPRMGKAQEYVMRFLEANGPSTVDAIMGGADTCSPNAARQAVYSLADIGKVKRVDQRGTGTKATYAMSNL